MKEKLFALFLAVVIVVVLLHFMPKPLHKSIELDGATCQVYCLSTTAPHTDVGFGKIVECSGADLAKVLAQCKQVDGTSFHFVATQRDFEMVQNSLAVIVHTTQTLGELTILCGYSPKVVGGVWLDGHKTNVQIAFDGNTITIGSPLILGDY